MRKCMHLNYAAGFVQTQGGGPEGKAAVGQLVNIHTSLCHSSQCFDGCVVGVILGRNTILACNCQATPLRNDPVVGY